jgi:CheY-like chemotaxis protein
MSATALTVLLVDDNEDNRIIYATYLRHRGYRVLLASTGDDGVAVATTERPDVILMDMTLPGTIDGCEATAVLKQDSRTAHIPVIALTAHASAEHQARAAAAGCAAYLRKPIEPGAVAAEVARWAAGARRPAAGA